MLVNFAQPGVIGLPRGMHRVEGEVQEEGLAAMPIDIRRGLAAQGIGQIFLLLRPRVAAEDVARLEVVVPPAEKAEELCEATALGMHFRQIAKMPLADQPRRVADGPQTIGDGRFADRQTLTAARIKFVSEPLLITAGHQAGPRRRTVRSRRVAAREPHARSG